MKKQKFLLFEVALSGFLLSILTFNGVSASSGSLGIQKFLSRKEAPSFSLKDLDGTETSFSQLKGKPLLLFFWGSFCPACKEDIVLLQKCLPHMEGLLQVFTIAVDGEKEKRVRKIVRELKITLPVLLDPKEKVARLYGVKVIPTAILIDRDGILQGMVAGQRDWCQANAFLEIKASLNIR